MFLPQETLRRKRDGAALTDAEIAAFVDGIARGTLGDAQIGAFAMAVVLRGMNTAETVALTRAMATSGRTLDWRDLPGPVADKHSSGGIGDTVSLMLGPMLAACGAYVPMISGRGLGHTGGTLDKLEALPGYTVQPPLDPLRRVVREAGVAIVGAGPELAPADRRLYAVRDVTATVESIALITGSILSKKLAAGLQHLVLDVKFGNGAFMATIDDARALARSLVAVGCGAGLPTAALLTDMNEPLAPAAGNALEVQVALDYLTGRARPARLHEVTLALGAVALQQAGLATSEAEARARLTSALDCGAAAERFARMVAGLGGPTDVLADARLPTALVCRPVPAPADGVVARIATRELGLAVVSLGGGRRVPTDRVDPAVGLAGLAGRGQRVQRGEPLAWVHAASDAAADEAVAAVRAAYTLADAAPPPTPVVAERLSEPPSGPEETA